MTKFINVLIVTLSLLTSNVLAQKAVDEIDLEVVQLLNMNQQQAVSYSIIMQRQRESYQILQPTHWQQKLAFYEETYDKLKSVLSEEQHIRFIAYMDSFIEAIPMNDSLVMK